MTTDQTTEPQHGGILALDVARAHGVSTLFTLSGAHVFPMYDAAVKTEPSMPIVDVRHEPTAVFAAEAMGKLTRTPGLAVLTAGPGVTNGVSAVAQASFSGSPLVVVGGRAPNNRWGTGSLQELDHPPIFSSISKSATTAHAVADIAPTIDEAFTLAGSSHRGPTFVDVPMDEFFNSAPAGTPSQGNTTATVQPDPDALRAIAELLRTSERPVLVLGTDVWADRAEVTALQFVQETGIPVIANGMGRGIVPGGHPQLVTKARSTSFNQADLVIVVGTPLDFRLGYGVFGGKEGATPARTVHVADSAAQVSSHADTAATAYGDLGLFFTGLFDALTGSAAHGSRPDWTPWLS
ncbi:MAG: thiamine pyrophosphate-binding protein, partial [Aeromicrobium sp.]